MSSSIVTTWNGLLTLIKAALPGVQVIDGDLGEYLAFDYVQVVDLDGNDSPATIGRPVRYNEDYSINCLVRAYAGNMDPPARRQRAVDMYNAIRDAINTDPSLGGLINGRAYATKYRMQAGRTEKGGYAAHIEFSVDVTNQTLT